MESFDWKSAISINLQVLRLLGLWPRDYEFYKFDLYLIYAITGTVTLVGGHNLTQIIKIFYVYSDLEALTATIFVAATNILAILKRYVFLRNLGVIKNLLKLLNTSSFRPRNEVQVRLIQPSVKFWKVVYVLYSIVVYTNVTMWLIAPILNNWLREHRLPFEAWYPFDIAKSPNYEVAYAYQFICIWYITIANLNLDTLIFAFMMFTWTQCDLLCDSLRNLDDFGAKLVSYLKHHQEVLRFAENSNNFFNLIILGQIATSTGALALTMFQLSLVDPTSGAAFSHLSYMIGITTQILLYCWFGNEVELKSQQIPYAVFESNWISQTPAAKRSVLILCLRCCKPIRITAINLFSLSLKTFLGILKSAWSYFAVLNTVNSK